VNTQNNSHSRGPGRPAKFLLGLAALIALAGFFASGVTPPGICGEVLRHNQANRIDASPLLYQEVQHMHELELRVAAMRFEAASRRKTATSE
jgi:hypothetical protein